MAKSPAAQKNAFFEYWYASDRMKAQWFSTVKDGVADPQTAGLDEYRWLARQSLVDIRLWYGCLYVALEAYFELVEKKTIPESKAITGLIERDKDAVEQLRRHRNAIFHFQRSWGHEKFHEIFLGNELRGSWIRTLHCELGRSSIEAELSTNLKEDAKPKLKKLLDSLVPG